LRPEALVFMLITLGICGGGFLWALYHHGRSQDEGKN